MFLDLSVPLVVFDLETTGVFPRQDRIIELAAIRVNPDGSEDERCWLLNPTVHIPEETTAIHGISDAIVKDCPTFAEKAAEIFDFFRDAALSGYNCDRFDIPCLEEEFARCGITFNASARRHIDVQRIYHKMFPRDLASAVREYLHRDHTGAHGAEADTRATLEVLKAQMTRHAAELPRTLEALDELLDQRDHTAIGRNAALKWHNGELLVNFGKNKGQKLKDLIFSTAGKRFLEWMLRGDFDTEVKQVVRDALENGRLPAAPKESQAK